MKCRTIAIFSNKGGVGKTFVAVNLAVALAIEKKKVLLVDLDSQAGQDICRKLNVAAKEALVELLPYLEQDQITTPQDIKKHVISHHSGLDFLPGITHPKQASHINPANLKLFLEKISNIYEFIIIDVGKAFTENLITVFDQTNLLLIVVTPDILSVYQTRWSLDILQNLRFPLKMIKLVLNRAESKGGVSWQEVKAALPCEIFARIPSEGRAVGLALNRGNPVVLDSPNTKVAKVFKKIAHSLNNSELYVEHQELEKIRTSGKLPRTVDFWEKLGIVEPLRKLKLMPEDMREDELTKLKKLVHRKLVERLNLKQLDPSVATDPERLEQLRKKAEQIISNLLAEETGAIISTFAERDKLVKEIADEALGLGPLEELLSDPEITDIMINNKDEVYVERLGRLIKTNRRFTSNEQIRAVIEKIVNPLGRRIDESVPMVDARLPDGSRVNAIIPPLSLGGPKLTIRKFSRERLNIDDLLNRFHSLTQPIADFLQACIISRKNMIVSGGTGSGKTTLLNIISSFIPPHERIITIEDAAELRLGQGHWVRLESRPPNIEGRGAVTVRDLFRNTLRMRPDRIIIGECRGPEVLDMLQAMNTGHDGSLTTIHANSTQDVLVRLDAMILMSGIELPLRAIREISASAFNVIIHTSRLSDGSRKVIQVTEVAGMLDDTHLNLKDIFVFKQKGVDKDGKVLGEYRPTGYVPTFFEEMKTRGILLSEDIFKK